jgi:hypothetical protein
MGDDDFVVEVGAWGFVVWCFDRNVVLSPGNEANRWVEGSVQARGWHPLGAAPR